MSAIGHRDRPGASRDGRWWRGLVVALLAWLVVVNPVAALAQTFPKFSNFVVDQADLLPADDEARLDRALADLQHRTAHQLAIVTVNSLQGLAINDYTVRLARAWGVGRKHYDDGVLILIAPKERKVRIEVGYGLEATLTAPRCAAIIRDIMLPAFAKGRFADGIDAGARAVIARLDMAAPLGAAAR